MRSLRMRGCAAAAGRAFGALANLFYAGAAAASAGDGALWPAEYQRLSGVPVIAAFIDAPNSLCKHGPDPIAACVPARAPQTHVTAAAAVPLGAAPVLAEGVTATSPTLAEGLGGQCAGRTTEATGAVDDLEVSIETVSVQDGLATAAPVLLSPKEEQTKEVEGAPYPPGSFVVEFTDEQDEQDVQPGLATAAPVLPSRKEDEGAACARGYDLEEYNRQYHQNQDLHQRYLEHQQQDLQQREPPPPAAPLHKATRRGSRGGWKQQAKKAARRQLEARQPLATVQLPAIVTCAAATSEAPSPGSASPSSSGGGGSTAVSPNGVLPTEFSKGVCRSLRSS